MTLYGGFMKIQGRNRGEQTSFISGKMEQRMVFRLLHETTTQYRKQKKNLHMNRAGYLRRIDGVGVELEGLFLFLLFRKKCCCVRHGEMKFLVFWYAS